MECDNTCLNHNSLVSKKNGHQRHDYKGGLLCIVHLKASLFYIFVKLW
jgi:hypothetical protein